MTTLQQVETAIKTINVARGYVADITIAEMLGDLTKADLRYDLNRKRWFTWDGVVWRHKRSAVVIATIIKGFLFQLVEAHKAALKPNQQKGLLSKTTLANVEVLMRTNAHLGVTQDVWDRDPYLMATPNGTVDLRSGHLRPGEPKDMITRITRSPIDPKGTRTPLWTAFLNKITRGDKELQKFFQLWFGLSLVGLVKEQKLMFLFGFGANGKNTLVDTLSTLAGDYATRADIGMFMQQRHLPHPTGMAKIISTPMVIGVEAPDEMTFNVSLLKTLTGEDTVAVRFMHADFFDAVVCCLITLTGNYKPGLHDVDEAIRRRLLLVHIDYTIPEKERVPRYHDTLIAQEGPGILRWAVDGAAEYDKTNKLPIPQSVREASDEYFAEQDIMRQFIEEYIELDNRPKNERRAEPWTVNAQELLSVWKSFAGENKRSTNHVGFKTKFLSTAKGVTHSRDKKGQYYSGLALKNAFREG